MVPKYTFYSLFTVVLVWPLILIVPRLNAAQAIRETSTYQSLKSYLSSIPAIDTHDHLAPFNHLPTMTQTDRGYGMTLWGLLVAHYGWVNPLPHWKDGESFEEWWVQAKPGFEDARATSFYREMLPAFRDLYGVDFDQITDHQARELNSRIFANYKSEQWVQRVITQRANIELMFIDPNWARLDFRTAYPFSVLVLNVTSLVWGFHPSEYQESMHPSYFSTFDNPYLFAKTRGLPIASLDDYITLLDEIFKEAKEHGAVCLKTTLAYERTLQFENVSKEQAAQIFGRPRSELTPEQRKQFEDFIMWRLVELSAKYDLPFQIHTGLARIQGSNPMLLVDLIEANPKTKFILFHGGLPWIDETGAIVLTELSSHAGNVWLDSVFVPSVSYEMAKRAYREWLDLMPSNRIMWGSDQITAEGIYGATEFTRRCLTEVLADKVIQGDLRVSDARRIGKQILRDNALTMFPELKARLWRNHSQARPSSNRAVGAK